MQTNDMLEDVGHSFEEVFGDESHSEREERLFKEHELRWSGVRRGILNRKSTL